MCLAHVPPAEHSSECALYSLDIPSVTTVYVCTNEQTIHDQGPHARLRVTSVKMCSVTWSYHHARAGTCWVTLERNHEQDRPRFRRLRHDSRRTHGLIGDPTANQRGHAQPFAPAGYRTLHRVSRICGADVYAVDGHIGQVEEFYFDDLQWTIRYLVVNTGSLLGRHMVLISPDEVKRNWGLAGFHVTLTREQVRTSPEIDPQRAPSRQDEERVLGHFGHPLYWKADGRSGSTPNLCSTKEVTGNHIQASDGEVGHVDDFLIDEASWRVDYLVVDTSNSTGGKWVLIAPMTLKDIDRENSRLRVALTCDAVKHSPSIDSVTMTPGEDGPAFIIM
jgi:hypothetical protein